MRSLNLPMHRDLLHISATDKPAKQLHHQSGLQFNSLFILNI